MLLAIIFIFIIVGFFRPGFLIAIFFSGVAIRGAGVPGPLNNLLQIGALAVFLARFFVYNRVKYNYKLNYGTILFILYIVVFSIGLVASGNIDSPLFLTAIWNVVGAFIIGQILACEKPSIHLGWDVVISYSVLIGFCVLSSGLTTAGTSLAPQRATLGEVRAVGFGLILNIWLCMLFGTLSWLVASKDILRYPIKFLFLLVTVCWVVDLALQNGSRGIFVGLIAAAILRVAFSKARPALLVISCAIMIVPSIYVFGLLVQQFAIHISYSNWDPRIVGAVNFMATYIPGAGGAVSGFDASIQERSLIWERVVAGIWEKPLLGHGTFSSFEYVGIYPHNFFLEIWYDLGIGGLLLVSALWLVTLWKAANVFSVSFTPLHHIASFMVVSIFVQAQFSFSAYMVDVLPILGAVLWITKEIKKIEARPYYTSSDEQKAVTR